MTDAQPPTDTPTDAGEEEHALSYAVPPEIESALAPAALERLKSTLELQKEHDEEHRKMVAEFIALELRYEVIFQALYKRRSEVLSAADNDVKGIPGFWLQVLKNSPVAELIEAYDEPILEHLEDISYEILPERAGYRLVFKFSPNEYFSETELVKTVLVDDLFGDEEIRETKGTPITWAAGKNVTVQLKAKPASRRGRGRGRGGRGGGNSKPQMREIKVPSIFRFFEDLSVEIDEDMSEDDMMMIAEQQENDHQVAMAFREVIIPRAAVLYTGEDADDGDDDDDDDEDGALDLDDDDSEDEIPVPRKARRNKKKKSAVEEVDSDEDATGTPALNFPSFSAGAAPAFNFAFGSGTGTTLGAPGGAKQFSFTPKSDKSA